MTGFLDMNGHRIEFIDPNQVQIGKNGMYCYACNTAYCGFSHVCPEVNGQDRPIRGALRGLLGMGSIGGNL
jgi:hypothetical protein